MTMDDGIRALASAIGTEVKGKATSLALSAVNNIVTRNAMADSANRVINAGLKDIESSGVPATWSRSGPFGSVTVVNDPAFAGPALKLYGVGSQVGVYSAYFDVLPGEVYNYSALVRGAPTGTTTYVMRVEYLDVSGVAVTPNFSVSTAYPGVNTTATFQATVTIPPNAVRARLFILHASSATDGFWLISNISFRRASASYSPADVLGNLQYPGQSPTAGVARVVTNTDSTGIEGNLYNGGYTLPSGYGVSLGSRAAPVADARPVVWMQKFSSANRATNSAEWDQGGGYFGLEKRSGDAYGAALTGFGRHESVDGGDLIGVHGRAAAYKSASKVWGGWFYAHAADPATVPLSIIGIEINLNSRVPDQGYGVTTGYSTGLLVVTQDSSLPVTKGIEVGRGTAAPNGHFHTGIKLRRDSILTAAVNSATAISDNEAILIEGNTSSGTGAHGIRFGYGNFRTGISFTESTFSDNAAIVMGEGHRIAVGPGAGVSTYVEFNRSSAFVNLGGMNLRLNNTKVLGERKTGWAAPTGTASRATFAVSTATLPEVAARLKALIDDLTSHGMIGP